MESSIIVSDEARGSRFIQPMDSQATRECSLKSLTALHSMRRAASATSTATTASDGLDQRMHVDSRHT